MGHDEHGPAYPGDGEYDNFRRMHGLPEYVPPYRCPICRGSENRYLECEYPGCPDGRDRGHPHALHHETQSTDRKRPDYEFMISVALVVGTVLWLLWPFH